MKLSQEPVSTFIVTFCCYPPFFDISHIYICGMAFLFSGPTLNQSALALLRGLSILRPMLLGFSSMAGIFQIPVQIDINVVL